MKMGKLYLYDLFKKIKIMTVYTYNDVARRFKRLKFGIAICLLCANVLFIEAQSMQPLPQKSEAD